MKKTRLFSCISLDLRNWNWYLKNILQVFFCVSAFQICLMQFSNLYYFQGKLIEQEKFHKSTYKFGNPTVCSRFGRKFWKKNIEFRQPFTCRPESGFSLRKRGNVATAVRVASRWVKSRRLWKWMSCFVALQFLPWLNINKTKHSDAFYQT